MPIKMADSSKIVLPSIHLISEAKTRLENLISIILNNEKAINPNKWFHCYTYLTVNQGVVWKGKSQRNPGAHFDGMQGNRYPYKSPVCHQYLVASAAPTIYWPGPFDFSQLDPNKHNFFLECDRQKVNQICTTAEPNTLYLQTAYDVHESPIVKKTTFRTFIRVEFSMKKFNRIGNTENPDLPTGWTYEDQPIPAHLI